LDAGTGICELGCKLDRTEEPLQGDILLTHTHWDHIHGLPFFKPAYKGDNRFCLYGARPKETSLESLLKRAILAPLFPIPLEKMGADFRFRETAPGEELDLGQGITVRSAANNHPDGGLSYRVQYGDKSCCYVTDTEHGGSADQALQELCRGAGAIIYDAHFTEDEYPRYKGWGHSTWREGVKLLEASGAKQLLLFHHHPERTDQEMAELEELLRGQYTHVRAAREGLVLSL
jgi:phosphoribosyl 1,2-cyclic phosphodiesterase